MAIRTTEFKVGLTVLLAIALLAWGIVWIRGYTYGQEVSTYRVYFSNVGALAMPPAGGLVVDLSEMNREQVGIAHESVMARVQDARVEQSRRLNRTIGIQIGAAAFLAVGFGLLLWRPASRPVTRTETKAFALPAFQTDPSWA